MGHFRHLFSDLSQSLTPLFIPVSLLIHRLEPFPLILCSSQMIIQLLIGENLICRIFILRLTILTTTQFILPSHIFGNEVSQFITPFCICCFIVEHACLNNLVVEVFFGHGF